MAVCHRFRPQKKLPLWGAAAAGLHTYLRTLDIAFSNRGRADLSNTP